MDSAFAQAHMAKCGWKEGRGLGREETGMTEAIKVKLKFDSTGFGHDRAEEFTFQWWDHVFNKAADNLSVTKNEKGDIELKQKEVLVVSKSRPEAARAAMKEKLYGSFVKGATLHGSKEIYPQNSSDESDEDDAPRDMSMKLSDDQLFKLCGGRTAHKGARHGLNMNAKLERIRLQEEELLRKWKGEEAQQDTSSQLENSLNNGIQHSEKDTPTEKKKKKKKHKEVLEETLNDIGNEETKNKRKYTYDEENAGEMKKKKKKNKHLDQGAMNDSGIESVEYEITENKEKKKKKKKLKEKKIDEENDDCEIKSVKKKEVEHPSEEQEHSKKRKKKSKKSKDESHKINEICSDSIDFSEVEIKKKKKKKKSKEIDANVEENLEGNELCSEVLNSISTDNKEKKKRKEKKYCSDSEEVEVKKKKKKSKSLKEYEGNKLNLENCNLSAITQEIKKKKKKIKESA